MSLDSNWVDIHVSLQFAVSIAWDKCHKIYIVMDDEQHSLMQSYGYDPLVLVSEVGTADAYDMLRVWWDESCGLRFVSAVRTVEGNPNDGFTQLIEQFEDEDEWDESDV